mmetsp:Transcript_23149/g.48500  ORF Transcript_23149/g.48500 Transcript_23149/m.48500 type:complete len:183 (+) Transcript_23149:842-1390(+)
MASGVLILQQCCMLEDTTKLPYLLFTARQSSHPVDCSFSLNFLLVCAFSLCLKIHSVHIVENPVSAQPAARAIMDSQIRSRLGSGSFGYLRLRVLVKEPTASSRDTIGSNLKSSFFLQAAAEAFGCTLEQLIPLSETYQTTLTVPLSSKSGGRNSAAKEELDEGGWEKLVGRFSLQPPGLQK